MGGALMYRLMTVVIPEPVLMSFYDSLDMFEHIFTDFGFSIFVYPFSPGFLFPLGIVVKLLKYQQVSLHLRKSEDISETFRGRARVQKNREI